MKKTPVVVVVIIVAVGIVLTLTLGKSKKASAPSNNTKTPSNSSSSNSSADASDQAVPTNAVSIKGMSFSPKAITVPLGATVHWNNVDGMTHTITADDDSFDSGSLADAGSFTHVFATAGTYKYHCGIHSSMTGTVIVRAQ